MNSSSATRSKFMFYMLVCAQLESWPDQCGVALRSPVLSVFLQPPSPRASRALLQYKVSRQCHSAETPFYQATSNLRSFPVIILYRWPTGRIISKQTSLFWRKLIIYEMNDIVICVRQSEIIISWCVTNFLWMTLGNLSQRGEEFLGRYSNGIPVSWYGTIFRKVKQHDDYTYLKVNISILSNTILAEHEHKRAGCNNCHLCSYQ
jgi:hypothetical protein